jgi:hypothetical protein
MPEARFIGAVFFTGVVIYVGMGRKSRDPARHEPHEEVERLRHRNLPGGVTGDTG